MKGHFRRLPGFPDTVLAVTATGKIDSDAYEQELMPMVEEQIAKTGKVRLVYMLGDGFEGFTAGAAWDDARLGLLHIRDFERIAIVTDADWIAMGVKLFAPLIPADVQVFETDDLDDVKSWINA
ncbi:STAS/SEC14 domain-containing protein [Actibacterium sp. XHP0104]|uniref:STAS/SEC14 domain-containing protein n=1 Tax=Actibacterium sp. XHP0104 TaxID=2984335 RepID=UPI0021E96AA9|nr:STAS/SEC14 domain-containing protein [Actibacterium sp. XHP0104]MCV2882846.1 STAS/SEC14 domain-containing protein [Actibacterium sp. XHP0104]